MDIFTKKQATERLFKDLRSKILILAIDNEETEELHYNLEAVTV